MIPHLSIANRINSKQKNCEEPVFQLEVITKIKIIFWKVEL